MPIETTLTTPRPLPIAERITLNALDCLRKVSASAGYFTTLEVERKYHRGNRPRHLLAVLHTGDDEELGDDDTACGDKSWTRPYGVQVFIFDSELENPDDYDQLRELVRADVHRALMADVYRGGLAQNTEIRNPVEFDDPNDASGIIIYFDVTYRHSEIDPTLKNPNGAT